MQNAAKLPLVKTVLIVEDDDHTLSLIDLILSEEGFKTIPCPTIKSAHQVVANHTVDLVLLDYYVGDETPEKLVESILTRRPVPIILITASTQADKLAECLKLKLLIKKPFGIETLLSAIHECLADPAVKITP